MSTVDCVRTRTVNPQDAKRKEDYDESCQPV